MPVIQKLKRSRPLFAACFGLLLAAAFPKWNIAVFAWIVPGAWLLCARGQTRRQAFSVGYAGGLAFNLATLSWLNNIPYPAMPTVGWLALSAYLALYPATWLLLCIPRLAPNETGAISHGLDAPTWIARGLWCLRCAVLWVALETIMSRFLGGFPWLLVANSQCEMLPLIQLASFTGAAGVSFQVVWFSASLASAGLVAIRSKARPWAAIGELAPPLLAVGLVASLGLWSLIAARTTQREITMALIQPSIPQTVKWDKDASRAAFSKVLDLTGAALALKPDILVWPEAATPGLLRYEEEISRTVGSLARANHVWIVLGADDAVARDDDPTKANFFNSAFLVSPNGELAAKYDKQRLVIFGEYVPLTRWLPFLKWFTPVGDGFTPGEGPVQFKLDTPSVTIAPMICFEDVFGFHTRSFVTADTDLLLNLTNDGWFGEGAAQWQHASMSVFRAVENGVPVVRCTNNGLTCWVDANGRMHDVGFGSRDDIYAAGFKVVKVPVGRSASSGTFYHRHGDWFAWACAGIAVLLLASAKFRGMKMG